MPKQSYYEKLKDPRWQKKRLEIMERDGFKCRYCGNAKETLNVHHLYYISGRSPWEYPEFSLKTLCETCHKSGGECVANMQPHELRTFEIVLGEILTAADQELNFALSLAEAKGRLGLNTIDLLHVIDQMLETPESVERAIQERLGVTTT